MGSREKNKQESAKTNFSNNEVCERREENDLDVKIENNIEDMKTDEQEQLVLNKQISDTTEINPPKKKCSREMKLRSQIPSPSPSLTGSCVEKIQGEVPQTREPLKRRFSLRSASTEPCSSKTVNIPDPNMEKNLTNENRSRIVSSETKTANVTLKQETVASLSLSKIDFDSIEIDNDLEDIYSKKPPFSPEQELDSDCPDAKRRRLDSENLVIARQCRLHPANKKYNQGPVVNPPLISPGSVVGYTPAGQRHEVDLNFQRPTWFNSEYARMQFDDATRINVRRMFNELETGMFLPNSLNPDVERRHNAERDLAEIQATEKFKKIMEGIKKKADEVLKLFEEDDLRFLETEQEMLELNEFATVKFEDFPSQLVEKLNHALTMQLAPLMFKKHPIMLETLQTLSKQCINLQVAKSAQALLNKIEGLFDVPETKTFQEHFASEVENLKEKTKDMDWCDILIMSKEPTEVSPQEETNQNVEETEETSDQIPLPIESNVDESSEEWIPVENDVDWQDIAGSSDNGSFNDSEMSDDEDTDDDESDQSNVETDSEINVDFSTDDLLATVEFIIETLHEQSYLHLLERDEAIEE